MNKLHSHFKSLSFILLCIAGTAQGMENKPLFERGEGFWTSPSDESKNDFFSKLTEPKSQREDWYKVSPYIAEFWCAISNAGFVYVGLQRQSPELLFAGLASIVSHSIPKQWLLLVDKLAAAAAVVINALTKYQTVLNHPWLAIPISLVGTNFLLDIYLARTQGKTWPHVAWHLSAAFGSDRFLKLSE